MNPIRFINNNFARTSTITGTSAAGFPAQRLANDLKSEFFKATANSVTLTCTFSGSRTYNCVSLPEANLTSGATLTVGSTTYTVPALTLPNIDGNPTGGNGFAYSSGRSATIWLPIPVTASSVSISVTNSIPLEASFLVVGLGVYPTIPVTGIEGNFALGASIGYKSAAILTTSAAGDSLCETGHVSKTMNLDLNSLDAAGKSKVISILRFNNSNNPLFISAFPENTSKEKEEEYTIYGRLAPETALKLVTCTQFSSSINITSL